MRDHDVPLSPHGEEITVRHELYGAGEVRELRRDPLPPCSCIECRKNPRPKVIMLVRWHDPSRAGCAGGWYDPACRAFDFDPPELVEARLVSLLAEERAACECHTTKPIPCPVHG